MEILLPIGRMIGGSLEKLHPRTDNTGKPVIGKDGQPVLQCNFGVAIPKRGEQHWNQTQWGAQMWNIGASAYPVLHQTPSFAWKVVDGDSTVPNKRGKIPNQQEGYAGHWILWFSQGWLPKLCNADGSVELPAGAIKAGYYVQVLGDINSNGAQPPNTPGLYLNPRAVALAGEGDLIVSNDVDTTNAGFGQGVALPPGARPVQPAVSGFAPPPSVPAAPTRLPPEYVMPAAPAAPPVVPVQPNAAFMAPPPAVPVGPQMTTAANGVPYEQWIANGWTDATLRQNGYML